MATLTQTAANVGIGSLSTITRPVTAGEALTQGQPVYRDDATGKFFKATAGGTQAAAEVEAIVLTPAATNGFPVVATSGLVNLGATLTVGSAYYLSDTAGQIFQESDLATGDYVTLLGIAKTAALLDFRPNPSRIEVP